MGAGPFPDRRHLCVFRSVGGRAFCHGVKACSPASVAVQLREPRASAHKWRLNACTWTNRLSRQAVGRQAELSALDEWRRTPRSSLMWITGPFGVGKTALAYRSWGQVEGRSSEVRTRSPLTDSNRRPPPYHRETRASAGHRDNENPANRGNQPKQSERAWTRAPALVFPPCSLSADEVLGPAGARLPRRTR
jgi:hypothetical protein